ncbi:MAG: aldehyde dehydrogenase [Blastocatellia bacterium]|nr:aldehyde dehydrogenase [Blastocatellia bacterium]
MEKIIESVGKAGEKWEEAGLEKRLAVLKEAGQLLADKRTKLCECLQNEGLSNNLARDYSQWVIQAADPNLLEKYAQNMVQWVNLVQGGELLIRRADGIVLVFGQAGSPTFNAATIFSLLLPGNGIIFVRAPFVDGGVRFIFEQILHPILLKHGFDIELVQLVTDKYREAVEFFVAHKELKTILSIGSATDNANIAKKAHENNKKVILEHYGRGSMVIWKDANIDEVTSSAQRVFDFSSRPCFIPKLFLVHDHVYDEFINAFIDRIANSKTVENDKDTGVIVPIGKPDAYLAMIADAQEKGRIRYGGYQTNAQGKIDKKGIYVAPTIVTFDAKDCLKTKIRCVDEEIFFPIAPVVRFRGSDEEILTNMHSIITRHPVGLRTSIWTNKIDVRQFFLKKVKNSSLIRFNSDHSQSPKYASFWGSGEGDNHLFWERSSHIQAIDCSQMSREETKNILTSLGCSSFLQL